MIPPASEDSSAQSSHSEHFNKVPLWTADVSSKRFEVLADDVSGRIPVTKLESWKNFTDLLDDPFFNRSGIQYVYRGHRRYDWALTPTLGRLTENNIVTENLAEEQQMRFRMAIRGRIQDRALLDYGEDKRQCDELWAVGQHHGLMTPLLDWTYSPYVALFFAFHKADSSGETENPYRVVYLLNKTFVDNDELCPDIRVLEPRKDDHGRLVNQAGLFTFSPTDATIENKLIEILGDPEFPDDELRNADRVPDPNDPDDMISGEPEALAKYICKIYIRNEDRDGCIKHLRRMNVHHASLFPDLIGAADYCNILAEEKAAEDERLKEEETIKAQSKIAPKPIQTAESTETLPEMGIPVEGIEGILTEPEEAAQVEPARIIALTKELSSMLQQEKAVDWKNRESVQARLRIMAKVTLRKYGYPASIRDSVAELIVQHMIENG